MLSRQNDSLAGGVTASMIVTQSTYFALLSQHLQKSGFFCGFIKVLGIGT
jgi:hypothetical protein